jgi:D-glycero-D-manno-heptose 1,7-bisphosphate phosphatase
MNKAVFLDRDGVINRKAPMEDQYITRWEEMEVLPGVAQAIAALSHAGFKIIIVTNQRGVAKGLITIAQLESIHQRMCQHLASGGAVIDAIYYCPHELDPPCDCRKPEPGMLLQAARAHNVDLTISWMIGDSVKDVQAGTRAGCKTVRIAEEGGLTESSADVVASSLAAAAHKILVLDRGLPLAGLDETPSLSGKRSDPDLREGCGHVISSSFE